MAVTAYWYGKAFLSAFNKEVDLDTDTVKVALCTSSYTPNQDTHDYYDDLSNEVANGSGYTTGGKTLTSLTVAYDGATNTFSFDAADSSWTSASFTARYAVIYVDTGTASTSPLLAYVNFGADQTVSSGTFTIQWNASGIAKVTVS